MICAACVCLTLMEDMRMCTVWLEVMSISAKPPAPEAAAAAAAAAAVLLLQCCCCSAAAVS
jgi:hypothetical protein